MSVDLHSGIQVVTVDGRRGTGKSRLASDLRRRFGCGVLDIGPLFRFIAWLNQSNSTEALEQTSDYVRDQLFPSMRLRICTERGSEMSATALELDGHELLQPLWDPELDLTIRRASESPAVVDALRSISHHIVGVTPVVVVGRDTGVHFFPEAPLKVQLTADADVRERRKVQQFDQVFPSNHASALSAAFERAEPRSIVVPQDRVFLIDTTVLHPSGVADEVSRIIQAVLGWPLNREV